MKFLGGYSNFDNTMVERYCFLPKVVPAYMNLKLCSLMRRDSIIHKKFYDSHAIYTHIPKAAGSSIGFSLLGHDKVGHYPLRYLQKIDPVFFHEAFKFTIVRHPVNRLMSAFYFLLDGGKGEWDRSWVKDNRLSGMSFESFVLERLDEKLMYSIIHLVPQYEFVCGCDGSLLADYVGKLEQLEDTLVEIKRLSNIELSVGRKNVTKTNYESANLPEKVVAKIVELYFRDFSEFGYLEES